MDEYAKIRCELYAHLRKSMSQVCQMANLDPPTPGELEAAFYSIDIREFLRGRTIVLPLKREIGQIVAVMNVVVTLASADLGPLGPYPYGRA
ncbi:MAG: hypothetical protein N3D11_05485 [Candidatus Sumerlaeia bacterium]|nr:hypothetical protein [Candidatus Sumerlaeia bacterium]